MIEKFNFATTPQLLFGRGKLSNLPSAISAFGSNILLVTGARSFLSSVRGEELQQQMRDQNLHVERYRVEKEPTPAIIDAAVNIFNSFAPDCVVAIGGGSALDAGKAISAMLPLHEGVKNYLEGVGTRSHPGTKIPFIAIPTTSGTGSEATKNAVISETGSNGFKRSLRHDNFVPNVAIVDPLLTVHCPPETTASSGMDAFTQLLESFLSTAANPLTDALALEGLRCISKGLLASYHDGSNLEARTHMSLAAYLSGVTLANAGLGLVHGFASPIGGYFDIPHGVICSTLMASCNEVTVRKLRSTRTHDAALKKYAIAGKIFSKKENKSDEYYTDNLLSLLESLTSEMKIPSLSDYGITPDHYEKIVNSTDCKNNPVILDKGEMTECLRAKII